MTDITEKIIDPPANRNFLTLEEAKKRLGLPATGGDPAADEQLEFQIADASAIIARLCNREFAKTKLVETWRGNTHETIYLRHWPVKENEVESVTNGAPGIWPSGGYEVEEHTGKIRVPAADPISITYSGGYLLPDEAPDDLKYACLMLMRASRQEATRESVEGIRMIAHKESRVIFFDPNTQSKTTAAAAGGSSGIPQVDALLSRYIRHAV